MQQKTSSPLKAGNGTSGTISEADIRTPKGNLEYCNYGITETRKQKRCQLEASPDTTHDDEIAVPTLEENLNNLSVK